MNSELKRVETPTTEKSDRLNYYTNIRFVVDGTLVSPISFKVDTGASYTIVSLDNTQLSNEQIRIIRQKGTVIKGGAFDASDNEIELIAYTIENFKLTSEIIIPRMLIYFTDKLKKKAILGMDILSLFEFQYRHEKHQLIGTFWIINYEQDIKRLSKYIKTDGYINPRGVMLIEKINSNTKHRTVVKPTNENNTEITRVLFWDRVLNQLCIEMNKTKYPINIQSLKKTKNQMPYIVYKKYIIYLYKSRTCILPSEVLEWFDKNGFILKYQPKLH